MISEQNHLPKKEHAEFQNEVKLNLSQIYESSRKNDVDMRIIQNISNYFNSKDKKCHDNDGPKLDDHKKKLRASSKTKTKK
jgi:hypothetical protein